MQFENVSFFIKVSDEEKFLLFQFCRSQLLNLAHTRRVTGVKTYHGVSYGVLKDLSYFNCFLSNIVKFSGDTVL